MMTLPGVKLLYEGQFEGRRIRPPVSLARCPDELINIDLQAFYHKLLAVVSASIRPPNADKSIYRLSTVDPDFSRGERSEGAWQLCERTGWPDNRSYLNLVAWCWDQGEARYLVVVNLSKYRSPARVQLPWNELAGRTWQLMDALSGEMQSAGLHVDLPAWRFHFLHFQPGRHAE